MSSQCRDLIARMLRSNAADRLTAEEILEHPWLKTNNAMIGAADQKGNGDDPDPKLSMKLVVISNPAVLNSLKFYRKKRPVLCEKVVDLLSECKYLNSHQMGSLKDFLAAADENGDGQISSVELHHSLQRVDPDVTFDDAQSIVAAIDADHNGLCSFDEILSARINRKLKSKESRLRKVFQFFDHDHDGKINAKELEAVWESVFRESARSLNFKEIISGVDQDGDGVIDYEEFISAFCKSGKGSLKQDKLQKEMARNNGD